MDEKLRSEVLFEAKRLINAIGKIIVIEWEKPVKTIQRIIFLTIIPFEPKGFKKFLSRDLSEYFNKLNFRLIEKKSCDYTQVIQLSK